MSCPRNGMCRIFRSLASASNVRVCAGFSDAGRDEAIHALGRPASEKRQGTKSREVGHRRCDGLYGDLAAASGLRKLEGSGRGNCFGSRDECAGRGERAGRMLREKIGGASAGQSNGPTQASALPGEGQQEWRVSLRSSSGGNGIMRCRSSLLPEQVSADASARSRARRSR